MPRLVSNRIQTQLLRKLVSSECAGEIHLIGEEQQRDVRVLDLGVLQELLQLLLHHAHTNLVSAVQHVYYGLGVLIIVFP
jgi:hypothetical protein